MSRQWQPGDVLLWGDMRVMYTDGNQGPRWIFADGSDAQASLGAIEYPPGRPLVVIDPEDREQVERLRLTIGGQRGALAINRTDEMQAALREFADPKPPKPEEPQGLGAVVEDRSGGRWVRVNLTHFYSPLFPNNMQTWAEIDAVEVLSEGVTS